RLADRNGDGATGVEAVLAAHQAVGAAQRDAADAAAAEVLLHFTGEIDLHALVVGDDFHGVVDLRQLVLGVFDVERRADDLGDAADILGGGRHEWRSGFGGQGAGYDKLVSR